MHNGLQENWQNITKLLIFHYFDGLLKHLCTSCPYLLYYQNKISKSPCLTCKRGSKVSLQYPPLKKGVNLHVLDFLFFFVKYILVGRSYRVLAVDIKSMIISAIVTMETSFDRFCSCLF